MTLKEFLEKYPFINSSALAKQMWPNIKSPRTKLYHKLNEMVVGTGKQRITEQDVADAKKILKDMAKDVDKIKIPA